VTARRAEESLNGADAIGTARQVVDRLAGPEARRVTGWATVDLDRAERDLVAAFGSSVPGPARAVPDDTLLGACCRLATFGVEGHEILLLEPATEGRIAASLARFGEGPIAVYVVVSARRFDDLLRDLRGAGLVLSAEAAGPFGRQRLVAGGPAWGAHLLIAEQAPIPPGARAATIER
jgi:hypothetical protein